MVMILSSSPYHHDDVRLLVAQAASEVSDQHRVMLFDGDSKQLMGWADSGDY